MRSSARRFAALAVLAAFAAPAAAQVVRRSDAPAVVTAVRRESLADAVRIVVHLDREVVFRDQRLEGPPRVVLDLANATAVTGLKDRALAFDGDVVRHVRLGRPSPGTTRVVLDLDGAAGYSVYPLYHPFRLVVDVERTKPGRGASPAPLSASSAPAGAPRIGAPPPRPTPRVAAAPPPPALPARAPAAGTITRGAAIPDPTPGASWLPDPLPARMIAVASASSTRQASPRPVSTIATTVPPSQRPAPVADPPPAAPARNTAGGYSLSRQLGLGISRVVIDAGHGGHDPGARVKGLNEADLVLDVALRLERLLKAQPGVEVVLTRRTNVYIPLEERTALANREGADLFLSIHANASENPKARGLETYYLNFAPNPEAERIAARENAGSARTMHALPEIVRAIALNNKIDESRDFAGQVQASLVDRLKRSNGNTRDLGVKQAPFMVLIGAAMPSVLAEISFITNDDESRLLKTADYRQHIAEALLQGILRYQRGLKASVKLAAQ